MRTSNSRPDLTNRDLAGLIAGFAVMLASLLFDLSRLHLAAARQSTEDFEDAKADALNASDRINDLANKVFEGGEGEC